MWEGVFPPVFNPASSYRHTRTLSAHDCFPTERTQHPCRAPTCYCSHISLARWLPVWSLFIQPFFRRLAFSRCITLLRLCLIIQIETNKKPLTSPLIITKNRLFVNSIIGRTSIKTDKIGATYIKWLLYIRSAGIV